MKKEEPKKQEQKDYTQTFEKKEKWFDPYDGSPDNFDREWLDQMIRDKK